MSNERIVPDRTGPFEYAPAPISGELLGHYAQQGYRSTVNLGALMSRNQKEFGSLPAVVDGPVALSWRELIDLASRYSGFLHANGIGPGDVVMWQLPNWWESLVVAYGVWGAGAISAPVVPTYREHELRHVVKMLRPNCVVAPKSFRQVDHVDLISDACSAVGWNPRVRVVLRGHAPGWKDFNETVSASSFIAPNVSVDAPALVGFTSGTTSGSKGVAHSIASFISSPIASARQRGYSWRDRSYVPAPLAHATGLLSAVAVPIFTGCSVILRDRWDAERAVEDITTLGVTFSSGAAIFVEEILSALDARGLDRLELAGYTCGGSSIPSKLAMSADAVGMNPARSWGMTECPSVTSSGPFEPLEVRCNSDGRITPGSEVRIVDESNRQIGYDQVGELLVRGPQRTLGYLLPEHTAQAFDEEGWFRTGDLGFITMGGVVTITGRSKEIINRGGEKISGREIEEILIEHPGIIEAAVVPAPDPRLGEQPAAFVRFVTEPVGEEELIQFLRSSGLAPHKIPRLWRSVDQLPRTASGKVKKYVLTAEIAESMSGQKRSVH